MDERVTFTSPTVRRLPSWLSEMLSSLTLAVIPTFQDEENEAGGREDPPARKYVSWNLIPDWLLNHSTLAPN